MRISFFIYSLRPGGAERVATELVNYWVDRLGWSITIFTLCGDAKCFFPLSERVHLCALDVPQSSTSVFSAISNNVKRGAAVRRAIIESHADVVIAFVDRTNCLVLAAAMGLPIPICVSERVAPGVHKIGRFWTMLRPFLYRWASAVVVQTKAARTYYARRWLLPSVVIANPIRRIKCGDCRAKTIVAIGRLDRQKGFDILISAFSLIARECSEWRVDIYGQGLEEAALVAQIRSLELGHRVILRGVIPDVGIPLARAGIFVLSSRYEGFPNALAEAMSAGVPVVSTDCPMGPGELIEHQQNGILVPVGDPVSLASAIRQMIQNPELRVRLGLAAMRTIEKYSIERISSLWQDVLITSDRGSNLQPNECV